MITAHGKAYETVEQAREMIALLQQENSLYGASDGRVTEILLIEKAIAEATPVVEAEPVFTVERGDYPMPCDHPMCALLHRRFREGSEMHDEWVSLPNGEDRLVRVRGVHEKTVRQWIILRDGVRVGDAYDTKREALSAAEGHPDH